MVLLAWAVGCGSTDCAELSETCTPQYEPTYDNVYANTLAPSCQLSGCHGEGSQAGGLDLGVGPDEAYDGLVNPGWIVVGDAACSTGFVVIHEGEMPPGRPLAAEEQCAVQQWIDAGASR